jgi:hypothetical protein
MIIDERGGFGNSFLGSGTGPDPGIGSGLDIASLLLAAASRLNPDVPDNTDCINFVNDAFKKVGATNYDGSQATASDLRRLLPKVRTDVNAIPPADDPDNGLYAAETGGGSSIYINSKGFAKVADQPSVLIGEGMHLKQFGPNSDADYVKALKLPANPVGNQAQAQANSIAFHSEVDKHCARKKQ